MRTIPILALLAALGPTRELAAQDSGLLCDFRDYLGLVEMPDQPSDLELEDGMAYVADRLTLQILDVSTPGQFAPLGEWDHPGVSHGLDVESSIVYLAVGFSGFQIVDAVDPANPALLFELKQERALTMDVEVLDGIAYFLDETHGLQAFDVTDPAAPVLLGGITDDRYDLIRIEIEFPYAYVIDSDYGFRVFDISDPAAMVELALLYPDGDFYDLAIVGDHAYLASGSHYLRIANIADPANPFWEETFDGPSWMLSLEAADGVLLIGTQTDSGTRYGLECFDLTNPALPVLLRSYDAQGRVMRVRAQDATAFLVNQSGHLQALNIERDHAGAHLGELATPGGQRFVALGETTAFVADGDAGIHAVDLTDPTTPTLLDTYDTPYDASGAALSGSSLLVADGYGGLIILSAADPHTLVPLSQTIGLGKCNDIVVRDDYAYLASTPWGLQVIDISNLFIPSKAATVPAVGNGERVDIDGDLAVVACGDRGITVFDIADPTVPIALADFSPGVAVHDAALSGGLAYLAVASSNSPVVVVDLSDPASPVQVGSVSIYSSGASRIEHGDGMLVVAGSSWRGQGVFLLDLRDPVAPTLAGRHRTQVYTYPTASAAAFRDTLAVIAAQPFGIETVNLADCPPCPADFNNDGEINTQDFIAFLQAWATERTADCSGGGCMADLDHNGFVDTRDFVAFLNAWATGC